MGKGVERTRNKTFLSDIRKDSRPITYNSDEDVLYELIRNSSFQKRLNMSRSFMLDQAARKKAFDMAENNYFAHTAPDGKTANENVREMGYVLPDFYPVKGNNIESLSIGGNHPEDTLNGWLNSPKHRPHVFGENEFYLKQQCIGIGKAVSQTDGRNIYVFISCPCY